MLPNINWADQQIIEYFGVPDNTKIINEDLCNCKKYPNRFISKEEVVRLEGALYSRPEKITYSLFNKRKAHNYGFDYCRASIDNEHPAQVIIDIDSIELAYMVEAPYNSLMHGLISQHICVIVTVA